MKHIPVLVISALTVLTVYGCQGVVREFPDGFRGTEWGGPPRQGWELTGKGEAFGGVDFYRNPSENLTLDGTPLESVGYMFWHDRLASVRLSFKGRSNYASILKTCEEKWGKGKKDNIRDLYIWAGDKKCAVRAGYSDVSGEGALIMVSKVVYEAAEPFGKADEGSSF